MRQGKTHQAYWNYVDLRFKRPTVEQSIDPHVIHLLLDRLIRTDYCVVTGTNGTTRSPMDATLQDHSGHRNGCTLSKLWSSGHAYAAARSLIRSATTRVMPHERCAALSRSSAVLAYVLMVCASASYIAWSCTTTLGVRAIVSTVPHTASPYNNTRDADNIINRFSVAMHGYFC
jgi:hypothetical protein